jgi:hypothetical protein
VVAKKRSIASTIYANVIMVRLTKANHVTWKTQVMVVLQGGCLVSHVTGVVKSPPQEIDVKEGNKLPNLAYEEWYMTNQQVLGFLLSTLSKEILPQVTTKQTGLLRGRKLRTCSRPGRGHSLSISDFSSQHPEGNHDRCRIHEQDAVSWR